MCRVSGLICEVSAGICAVLLFGCASPPVLDNRAVNSQVTPEGVSFNTTPYQGRIVQWGGKIVALQNLPEFSEVQILAYPLNKRGVPRAGARPQGRFILRHPGFLDPLDYAAGRWLTTIGTITELTEAHIGRTTHKLPVLQDQQLKLWRYAPDRPRFTPQFSIGIGVGF